ncbi:MAG TPA: protein kinase [Ktedonobacteraceae bacterium]|nr:protein kinase [Ktedonobacteraceae bacterium]
MQIEMLGERYQLQDPIGRGGMATIYRGRDLHMDREVAIKVLREVYSTDPKFVKRFELEAKAASALQHPNIVQVYDYGLTDGNYFIVMELVEGTDLRRYLKSRGILDVDRAVIIAHDVALGLGAAHRRNIVHRDVKPQNILVGRRGTIKLTDFGIASVYKDMNAERLTTTGMTLGTVQYYAPEQAQGEIVTPAADVYALGIVMYEMLTGHPPFDGDTPVAVAMQHIQDPPTPPSQLNPNIPLALEDIILRCLEKVPEMRYRDGSQLARALEMLGETDSDDVIANAPTITPGQSPVPPYKQTLPRPNSGGRTIPQRPTSSPNNMLNGAAASNFNGVDRVHNSGADRPPLADQPAYMPPYIPQGPAQPPYQRRTLPRSEALQNDRRESRLAAIVTALIILATIVLLVFSIYLASAQFHLFNLPFATGGSTPTATTQATALVPDLKNLSYSEASAKAANAGFTLCPVASTSGVVTGQRPDPGRAYPKSDCILVTMGPMTVNVPPGLTNVKLSTAENILTNAGLKYIVVSDGSNPKVGPDIVAKTNPPSGQPIDVTKPVTLYVWNLNATPVPSVTPSPNPSPSPSPSPSPTSTRTPTPTPTTTPTPTSTATSTPTPTPTTTPGPTASIHQSSNITSVPPGKSGPNNIALEVASLWVLLLLGLARFRLRKRITRRRRWQNRDDADEASEKA